MITQSVGQTGLAVGRLAYGCMRIAGTWNPAEITPAKEAAGREALLAAYEAGYTLFDHADIYCAGGCEEIHGRLLADTPSLRKDTIIATKCGIRFPGDPEPNSPHRYDFRASHIVESCEKSLRRLQIETIDIYQLHRPDYLMDPEEVAEAFAVLHAQGKVRYFGVSNFLPAKVRALQAYLPFSLVVNQIEFHLGHRQPLEDGTMEQCLELSLTPLAWSPLGGGYLGEGAELPEHRKNHAELVAMMDRMAGAYGVSRTEIALAWLLLHPANVIPILGSTRPEKIAQAVRATEIELGREDWYRLLVAAQGCGLP